MIELTVVMVTIGIMAAIALPNFTKFITRTKQTEAKGMLPIIASYQHNYKLTHGTFLACPENPATQGGKWDPKAPGWSELGFEPQGRRYYSYEIVLDKGNFIIKARGAIDKDATVDLWTFDGATLRIINDVNDVGR